MRLLVTTSVEKTTFPCPASMYSALMVEVATTCPATKTVLKTCGDEKFQHICSDHSLCSEEQFAQSQVIVFHQALDDNVSAYPLGSEQISGVIAQVSRLSTLSAQCMY
ncbi:hypothetical protein WJX77_012573 [Trebouxia sp. C0004]